MVLRTLLVGVVTFCSIGGPAIRGQAVSSSTHLHSADFSSAALLPTLGAQKQVGECSPAESKNQLPVSTRWSFEYNSPIGVEWLRPHLSVVRHSDSNWMIQVRDSAGGLVDSITSADIIDNDVWTKRVMGQSLTIALVAAHKADIQVCLSSVNYDSPQALISPKAVTGDRDRRVPLQNGDPDYKLRNPVAAIFFQDSLGRETNCTGFPITTILVLTAAHCISDPKQLRTAEVRFGFEISSTTSFSRGLRAIAVKPNIALDYSVLQLDSPVPLGFVAKLSTDQVSVGKQLILMQHPEGRTKMVVTEGCIVKKIDADGTAQHATDFFHLCDSSGGASGAPVMDSAGVVVGMEHLAVFNDDANHFVNLALKVSVIEADLSTSAGGVKVLNQLGVKP